jgi:hypothetical protein
MRELLAQIKQLQERVARLERIEGHAFNTDTGTTSSTWQLDNDAAGPILKNSAGNLLIRASGDAAYATLTAEKLISNTTLQLALTGSQLKSNAAVIEARNAADSAYVALVADTVTGNNGVITKVAAGAAAGGVSGQLQIDSTNHLFYLNDAATWRGAKVIETGSAFPAGYTDQLFYRSDRDLLYNYDGTRWITVNQSIVELGYSQAITFPASATASAVLRTSRPDELYVMWLDRLIIRTVTNTTLDATNNWTVTLVRQDSTGASTNIANVVLWQTGRTAGTPYLDIITLNTTVTVTQSYSFHVDVTKNSAPGTLGFHPAVLIYRQTGT